MSEKTTIQKLTDVSFHKPKKFFKFKGLTDGEEVEQLSWIKPADFDAAMKPHLERVKSSHENWVQYEVTANIGVVVNGDSVEVTEPSADAGPAPVAPSVALYTPKMAPPGYTLADFEALDEWAKHRVLTSGTPELQAIRYRCLFNNAVMKGLKAGIPIPGDEPPLDESDPFV